MKKHKNKNRENKQKDKAKAMKARKAKFFPIPFVDLTKLRSPISRFE
jgi:hypothetical protein